MTQAKTVFWNLINLAVVLVIVCGALGLWYVSRYVASLPISRTIVVNAEGKSRVVPDLAMVSFAVVSEGKTAESAQSGNNAAMKTAIEYLKSQGVEDKDIQTMGYNLSPRYEYDEKKKKTFISGYAFTQTVSAKLRGFEKAKTIIGSLPSLGINQINNVSFDVEDPEAFAALARQKAFAKAREKAIVMAKQNGVQLGRVVTFSENQGVIYPRFFAAEAIAMKSVDVSVPAPLEPGTEEVAVNVSVTYELR